MPESKGKIIIDECLHYLSHLQLGDAAKLKPLEVELKRLEDLSASIVGDFTLMREREQEMRDTNGKSSALWGLLH